ncbi:MAG: carbohydrate porin [Acidobacteria bacterium]|nr:carbohydrate porin [Acidobacteriota bacterium]
MKAIQSKFSILVLVTIVMLVITAPCAAQQTASADSKTEQNASVSKPAESKSAPAAAANPFQGKFMFGDWGRARSKMAEKGVNWDISFTQFGQGLTGGPKDTSFDYANKFDVLLNIDTGKAGLWKGGGIGGHVEIRYGDSLSGINLFPANGALYTPSNGPNRVVVTSLYATQKLGEKSSLMIGKINTVDLLGGSPFIGGRGVDGFMHIVLVAPPSGVTPVSTYGAMARTSYKKVGLSLFVYDPTDQTSWKSPFQNGVNFSLGALIPQKVAGRSATHSFSGTFSTSRGTNLADIPQLLLPPAFRKIGTKQGPFNISYQYEQYFYQNPNNPREGWGFFGKVAIADGNPNIIQSSFLAGIAGTGLIRGRSLDRFGVGFFNYRLSDALRDAVRPIVRIKNEKGGEVFYNFAVTPWFRVTADMQILPPTIEKRDTTVFFALRGKVSF